MEIAVSVMDQILGSYDEKRECYADLARVVSVLLETVVAEAGVVLHSSTYRCKDRQSLAKKIGLPGKSYSEISDVTDIAGVRLTTYFADDVDKVADAIRAEFCIDEGSSVDKRIKSDPDRFGYLSLHFIARLSSSRSQLIEYRKFDGMKFEIQIRSILQHAWAEIEHDIGYKSASGVPSEVRRRFARVSGLLELADLEFCGIRDQLVSYERELPGIIAADPGIKSLDLPTMKLLVSSDEDLIALDVAVVEGTHAALEPSEGFLAGWSLDRLLYLGVRNVGQLKDLSQKHRENVRDFSRYWSGGELGAVDSGIGAFYLCYVLVWASGDPVYARGFFEEFWSDSSDEHLSVLVRDVLSYAPGTMALRNRSGIDD